MSPDATMYGIAPGFDPGVQNGTPERRTSYTARELMAETFPEPRYAIPELVSEGLSMYAGPPKAGKSWLALNLAIAVASGGRALGAIQCERGDVLYLALEDGRRRLQARLRSVLGDQETPDGLYFETEWPKLPDGGTDAIAAFLKAHPATRLVVIDVFAKVRAITNDRADRYAADYAAVEPLKALADSYSVAVLLLHHTRKAASDDFLETVSGTHGIAGAADSVLVMRRARGAPDAELHVTGRDIEERSLALRFEPQVGTWTLMGDAAEFAISEARRDILAALKLTTVPMTPKVLASMLGKDHAAVKQTLWRMAQDGQVTANGDGTYINPVTSVTPLPTGVANATPEPLPSNSVTEVTALTQGDADA